MPMKRELITVPCSHESVVDRTMFSYCRGWQFLDPIERVNTDTIAHSQLIRSLQNPLEDNGRQVGWPLGTSVGSVFRRTSKLRKSFTFDIDFYCSQHGRVTRTGRHTQYGFGEV